MSRDFKASESSPSIVLIATVVLLALFMVGALVLLVLGGMFFFVWSRSAEPAPPPQPVVVVAAPEDDQPQDDQPQDDQPQEVMDDSDGSPVDAAPDRSAARPDLAAPVDAAPAEDVTVPAPPANPAQVDSPDPDAERGDIQPQAGPGRFLLDPDEVLDVHLRDAPLIRTIQVSGEAQEAIWAQPVGEAGVSQIGYLLDRRYKQLRGQAVVADAPREDVSDPAEVPGAIFRIYGDGNLLWDTDTVSGHGASRTFELDVSNVDLLVLVVDSASSQRASPFAWAGVELRQQVP